MARQDSPIASEAPVRPGEPLDLTSSVAGEEDPGASIDLVEPRGSERRRDPAAGPTAQRPVMNPGDEAPAGTPGTGEAVCPRCGGSGRLGAADCPDCGGTGRIIAGIGGA